MKKQLLFILSVGIVSVNSALGQKAWAAPEAFGHVARVKAQNPGIELIDIAPANLAVTVGAWDWVTDDKIVITHWIWNPPAKPSGEIWMMEGVKSRDKSKTTLKKYYQGTLREPLGVKVVDGEVYVAMKYALVKMVDANKDGVAEAIETVVEFPHREDSYTYNHYSTDLKYRDGFFYVALPSGTVAHGFPSYPIMKERGTVVKINVSNKSIEYLISGLRTPDGLGWGPDGSLFVTDNQGAWLPSSKLIHVTNKRFFGLQPVETGDPALVESPPAVWMPHTEASKSPTQPMLLSKGPYAGQFLIGDNVQSFVNRVSLDKVKGEYQGALFHFTGGLTCGVHRLLQDDNGDILFGGLGSRINSWNANGKFYGMQVARFTGETAFEVKEILSRADGFTLKFTQPVGPSAEDPDHYRLRHWRYVPTKEYGGPKIDNVPLSVKAITVDASRTFVHLAVDGLLEGRVVDFQFHRDILSQKNQPIWTGQAWYTLNQISEETRAFPTALQGAMQKGFNSRIGITSLPNRYALELPEGKFSELVVFNANGKIARKYQLGTSRIVNVAKGDILPGIQVLALYYKDGGVAAKQVFFHR